MKKKVAVLGAGFAGLTVSYELLKKGEYEVSLFEKENSCGGLAAGFRKENWQWTVEKSYHHLFQSDSFALNLAKELKTRVIFKKPVTANFVNRQIIPFDSPLHLLTYPYLNFPEKIRTGLTLAYLKLTPFWRNLEKETAKNWLIRMQGRKTWENLWEPLFIGKFGRYHQEITMSWFWARIKKRSASLGYPEGGFQNFASKLAAEIKKMGGKIYLKHEIQKALYEKNKWYLKIKSLSGRKPAIDTLDYDMVISTLPLPVFLRIFNQLPRNYVSRLKKINHLNALNLLLELKEPFLPPLENGISPYWLNIQDTSFPFLAVVEHTNFMNKKYYGGHSLVYIGNYLPSDHRFFRMEKEELLKLFIPYLRGINPSYNFALSILNSELFYSPFAQPVVTTKYAKIRPGLTTPLPHLYCGNLDTVYPWDRGTNYAIELGKRLANLTAF